MDIKILIVDDSTAVVEALTNILSSEGYEVESCSDGESGWDRLVTGAERKAPMPDLLLLDLNMPGIGGIETISRLRAKDPDAHILVFSMHDSPIMISRAVEAGASGYLTKSSAAAQMVDAVRTIAEGKSFLKHNDVPTSVKRLQNNDNDPLSILSKREFEVFCRLAAGCTIPEIATYLSISPKTAGVHQTNIMKKLQLRNTAELVRLAIQCGVSQP